MASRVLIVDDHSGFRAAARHLLEFRGHAVVGEAADAASAVEAAIRLQPDAVLLDVGLGADDGFAVAQALARACPRAAVLLVSSDDYRERADASGARPFMLKSQLAVADLAACWRRDGEQAEPRR
jgi:DNA-binding NarL/FixJ family response regulator